MIIDEAPDLVQIVSDYKVLLDEKVNDFDKDTYEYLKKMEILSFDKVTKQVRFNEKDKYVEKVRLNRYQDIFNMCKQGRLFEYSSVSKTIFINKYDPEILKCFTSVRLLTYLYEGSLAKAYFDLEGFDQKIIDYTHKMAWSGMTSVKDLITFIEIKGESHLALDTKSLSKSWFQTPSNSLKIEKLKKLTENYFKNKTSSESEERLWTTFIDFRDVLKGIGYTKKETFLQSRARATNDYRHTNTLAYLLNLYMNPLLYNFFSERGVKINTDLYATGEMIQWLYRSCIRDDKPIKVFVPSIRMKRLLKEWIENIEKYAEFSEKMEEERWKDFDGTCNLPGLTL